MKPYIKRCPSGASCHGMHSGPWMLYADYANEFTGHATWRDALVALARWYERKAARR